jgi:hypothetical protein
MTLAFRIIFDDIIIIIGWLQLTGLNVMRSYPARARGEQEEF